MQLSNALPLAVGPGGEALSIDGICVTGGLVEVNHITIQGTYSISEVRL